MAKRKSDAAQKAAMREMIQGYLKDNVNNPASVSLLSGNWKTQIRFSGNRHSDGGKHCHISFRMYSNIFLM